MGIECGEFSKAHRRFDRSTHPTLRWLNQNPFLYAILVAVIYGPGCRINLVILLNGPLFAAQKNRQGYSVKQTVFVVMIYPFISRIRCTC